MRKLRRLGAYYRWYGLRWTALRLIEWAPGRVSRWLDERMAHLERDRGLSGPGALHGVLKKSDPQAVERVREYWDTYPWRDDGTGWTQIVERTRGVSQEEWAARLIRELVSPRISEEATVLEIGPGGGRWSAILQPLCARLMLLEVSSKALDICRARFAPASNVEYVLSADGTLGPISSSSIDLVFAYGVFVDFDQGWAERLIADLPRILRPGREAVIHHRDYLPYADATSFEQLSERHGLEIVQQNFRLAARPGEMFTVMRRPEP